MDLTDLYQEIILDHNKRPRNYRALEPCTHHAEGRNPLCGDELTVYLLVKDGVIQDVTFQGEGCAISKASASLMTSALKGKKVEEAEAVSEQIKDMLTGKTEAADMLDTLGDLAALGGVKQFPQRVKCATLAWHTCETALTGDTEATTE